jgi:hypothetical protein
VHQIHYADEQVGTPNEQKICIVYQAARVPGKHKNGVGNENTKYLGQRVEKQVIVVKGARQNLRNLRGKIYVTDYKRKTKKSV